MISAERRKVGLTRTSALKAEEVAAAAVVMSEGGGNDCWQGRRR